MEIICVLIANLVAVATAVFFPLALFFGVLFGAWNGVRNSPTVRSRRFMLKATVFQAMTGLSLFVFLGVFARSCNQFCSLQGQSPMQTFTSRFFTVAIVLIGLYCVVSSYVINRRWRKIVEEDTERPVETAEIEQSYLSLHRLRKFLCYSMICPFIAIVPTVFFTMFMLEQHGQHWWTYFNYRSLSYIYSEVIIFPPLGVMVTVAIFYFTIEKEVVDEQSLVTWRREVVPNFLQVLTGEEKPRTGWRYRTNLWCDLLLVGVGFCMLQGGLCANYELDSDAAIIPRCYQGVFALSLLVYILFAVFYAGVPRRRYFGYIYFGLFQWIFSTFFVLFFEPWLYGSVGEEIPHWHSDRIVLALILFWLTCFVMVGVAGLYAFRKRARI